MKIRNGIRWSGALAIVALVAGTVVAQPPGGRGGFGGGRGPGNPLALLAQEPVQKELGLSAEAIEKGRKVLEEMREAGQAEMQKVFGDGGGAGPNMTDEQRKEMQSKMAATTQALHAKFAPQVKALLSEEQYARLQQIGWQVAGSNALTDAEVVKQLGLSKEQTEKIAASNQEYQAKQFAMMREAFAGRGGPGGQGGQRPGGGGAAGGGDFRAKAQELNKERDAKALDVLTADQKAAFEKLKGKSFDVSQLQMGRGPGGPGGGQPGAGGRPGRGGRPGAGGRPGQPSGDEKK